MDRGIPQRKRSVSEDMPRKPFPGAPPVRMIAIRKAEEISSGLGREVHLLWITSAERSAAGLLWASWTMTAFTRRARGVSGAAASTRVRQFQRFAGRPGSRYVRYATWVPSPSAIPWTDLHRRCSHRRYLPWRCPSAAAPEVGMASLRVFPGRLTRQAPSCGGPTMLRTWPAFTKSGMKRAIAWNAAIWFE